MLDVELSDFLIHPITLYARQSRVQAIPAPQVGAAWAVGEATRLPWLRNYLTFDVCNA